VGITLQNSSTYSAQVIHIVSTNHLAIYPQFIRVIPIITGVIHNVLFGIGLHPRFLPVVGSGERGQGGEGDVVLDLEESGNTSCYPFDWWWSFGTKKPP
jgi:hypothetical protein